MPYTEHDLQLAKHLDYEWEHSHYIGADKPDYLPVDLSHSHSAQRTYNLRGDWYAVHTH